MLGKLWNSQTNDLALFSKDDRPADFLPKATADSIHHMGSSFTVWS